jgi:hypothetical protein
MPINVKFPAASPADGPVSEAGDVLALSINGVVPGALFHLMHLTSVVHPLALV